MPDIYILYCECEDGGHMEFIYVDITMAKHSFDYAVSEASLYKTPVITLYSTYLSNGGTEVKKDDVIARWEAKSVTTYFYDQGEITERKANA